MWPCMRRSAQVVIGTNSVPTAQTTGHQCDTTARSLLRLSCPADLTRTNEGTPLGGFSPVSSAMRVLVLGAGFGGLDSCELLSNFTRAGWLKPLGLHWDSRHHWARVGRAV